MRSTRGPGTFPDSLPEQLTQILTSMKVWTFALPVEPVAPIVAGQAALASESMIVSAVSGVSRGSSEVAKIL